jgi:hypothetical protein
MLTASERQAVSMAGRLATLITNEIIGHGPTREQDVRELEAAVHLIQWRVMAQAAARLYPGEFRLLGEECAPRPENKDGPS